MEAQTAEMQQQMTLMMQTFTASKKENPANARLDERSFRRIKEFSNPREDWKEWKMHFTSAVRECPLCMAECTLDQFPILRNCPHLFCMDCLHTYTKLEIHEGRVNLKCPQCNELIHPNGKEFCLKLSYLGLNLVRPYTGP